MIDFLTSASKVLSAANKHGSVAVFIIDGQVKTTGRGTSNYDKAIKRQIRELIGVYNHLCPLSWIEEDLVWAEKRYG